MIENNALSLQSIRDCIQNEKYCVQYTQLPEHVARKVERYGAPVGSRIEIHEKIPRCMARLQNLINEAEKRGFSLPSGTVVMSRELENGSGRFARDWFAPQGGIWMAMAWADTLLPEYARLLPLAAGTACCEAARHSGIDASIKWVNDIHVQGRKIGGILCETYIGKRSQDRYHLIGIGVNCNIRKFSGELRETAVSIHELLGCPVDLNRFAALLLSSLSWNFGLVHLQEEVELAAEGGRQVVHGKGPVVDAWTRLSDTTGRLVRYGYDVVRKPLYIATVKDIDKDGGLVMRLENGEQVTEYSGEIQYID